MLIAPVRAGVHLASTATATLHLTVRQITPSAYRRIDTICQIGIGLVSDHMSFLQGLVHQYADLASHFRWHAP